jgi:cytochrome c oxidase assembly protein subunit 15
VSAHATSTGLSSLTLDGGRSRRRFAIFASLVLAYNIPVILWGAYVRVSFSGDGCGANWPFCNGQVIPQRMSVPTIIELTHRLMTGVDSVLVIAMCVLAFLLFPPKHAVRRYSVWSLVFLFVEALLGAGLVLFRMVARDQSVGRVWYLSGHLTNTLLLLGALTATAWVAARNVEWMRAKYFSRPMLGGLFATVFVSVTGAVAALGDMLYPASSLPAGIRQDFSGSSSMLLRLRTVHPIFAVAGAAYLLWLAARGLQQNEDREWKKAAAILAGVVIVQLAAGMVNLSLLAPIWMQLTHLFIADLVWIAAVVLALQTAVRTSLRPAR